MGRDKAFVEFEGRPLVVHAIDLARRVNSPARPGSVRLIIHRDQMAEDRYRQLAADFGIDLLGDDFEFKGPLGGLVTALRANPAASGVLLLACDMPCLTRGLIQLLIGEHRAGGNTVTVPVDPQGRRQPLVGIYAQSVLPFAEKMIGLDILRFESLLDQVQTVTVDFAKIAHLCDSDRFFTNLNRPEDLVR